jgi:hypothetical protein
MELGMIEMTLPETPTSRMQRYRLTDRGQSTMATLLKELKD